MAVIVPIVSKFDASGIKKSQSAFAGLSKSLKGAVGALGIATSFVAITRALEDASKAAIGDVKSQTLLANQLRNTVGATDSVIASSEEYIKSLMLQTSIADDQLRPAYASLVRATGSVSEAQRLLTLSTNIAAGTGKDLSSVSVAVGKAAAGQTTALFRLIPSLKGSSNWSKEAAKQFEGMAESAAATDPYKRMEILFAEMAETIGMALLPYLNDVADYFASPEGQAALEDFATSVTDAVTAIGDLGSAMGDLKVIADPVFGYLNGLVAAFAGNTERAAKIFYDLFKWIPGAKNPAMVGSGANTNTIEGILAASGKLGVPDGTDGGGGGGGNNGGAKKAATDYVAEFYKNIADEGSKQRASAMLAGLGLSEGLVDSIIGSQDWRKVFIKVKNSGAAALAQLQADFNKTAKGAQELADEIQKIADYTAAVADLEATRVADIAQATQELTDAANSAIKDNNDQLASFELMARDTFTTSIKTLNAYRTLGQTIDMGQFESEILSAFENVKSGLEQALSNKSITQEAYRNLLTYATQENQALTKIGRQRDELAQKRSLVEALMGDVKSALVGFANINQVAQATTQTVTETTSRLINSLSVQTSRTFEVTQSGNAVADNFRTMIEKARNFVSVLKTLKDQGLNAELFKQIVDAGVEAGTATAEGILAGGPNSISEINGLFGELQTISADAAETTAVVMYNNGENVVGGFLAGLVSQDEALANLASGMADSFATSFELSLMVAIEAAINSAKAAAEAANAALLSQLKDQVAAAVAEVNAQYAKALAALGSAPTATSTADTGLTTLRLGDIKLGDYGAANSALANKLIASPQATAWNTSITINAGMGTDGKSVGQLITAELNKFAKANGIKVS